MKRAACIHSLLIYAGCSLKSAINYFNISKTIFQIINLTVQIFIIIS